MFANKNIPIDHGSPHVAVNRLYQYVKVEREMSVERIGGFAIISQVMMALPPKMVVSSENRPFGGSITDHDRL